MQELIKAITSNKVGQAFDNLLKQTMGDGFKSKCVVASYFCMYKCGIISLGIFLVMLIIFAIGVFTNVPVPGDVMVEYLKVLFSVIQVIESFFAIAVATTMGATAFELFSPNSNSKITTAPTTETTSEVTQ